MKKVFLIVALIATAFSQQVRAQDTAQSVFTPLLSSYYNIKDALVKSNSGDAAKYAADFFKSVTSIDPKSLSKDDQSAFSSVKEKLSFNARHISQSTDISHQREHFAAFSENVYKLTKAVKLSDKPVYYAYCPMKKSYWLSADAAIKNPYYGNQMLTCGKVSETINK
nr:DUF3347 domain-containing protein [uncultured Mucilaginibacter sp.]